MRLPRGLITLALCASARAWTNPFADTSAEAPSPVAETVPHPGVVAPEAAYFHDAAATVDAASQATPSVTRAGPVVLPTPTDWFNGEKPLAFQPYQGTEYRWKRILFRPQLFQQEALALMVIALFSLFVFSTKDVNQRRAQAWLNQNRGVLEEAFAAVDKDVTAISGTQYAAWATGRKGYAGLQLSFEFKPRTDPFLTIYYFIRTLIDFNYVGAVDQVKLDFILADDSQEHHNNDQILAITTRNGMQRFKQARWDLRAFTTLSSSNAIKAPQHFAVFQETPGPAESTLKSVPALAEWLNGSGQGQDTLSSLVISDIGQMTEDPTEEQLASAQPLQKSRRVTATVALPSSVAHYDSSAILIIATGVSDLLTAKSGIISQNEALRIRKRRIDIIKDLTKEFLKEQAEAAAEKVREAKRKEQEAKYNAMTPEQQRKADDLARKRKAKAAGPKVARR